MASPKADHGAQATCLDDIQVESALLSTIADHRPIGLHRHWNIIPVLFKFKGAVDKLNAERKGEGKDEWEDVEKVEDPEAIRVKLSEWYDLDALNEVEEEAEDSADEEEEDEAEAEEETEQDETSEESRKKCWKCQQGFSLLKTFDYVDMIAQRAAAAEDSDDEELSELETTDADSPVKVGSKRKAARLEGTATNDDDETEGEDEEVLATRRGTRSAARKDSAPPLKTRRSTRK